MLDAALRTPSRPGPAPAVRSFIVGRTDPSWALPRIPASTLVVATDSREDCTPDAADAMVRSLPRGRSAVVTGSGVLAPLEQPRVTADLVPAFRDWADRAG